METLTYRLGNIEIFSSDVEIKIGYTDFEELTFNEAENYLKSIQDKIYLGTPYTWRLPTLQEALFLNSEYHSMGILDFKSDGLSQGYWIAVPKEEEEEYSSAWSKCFHFSKEGNPRYGGNPKTERNRLRPVRTIV